ncbi:zinc finger MYM-type protein 4 isoform X2 [Gadus morhua]|uniref:zinc finger MYM-type protein 4 isoform X2 n=1 Tax=Gadus morhua TaxID=8049 RepID=UPI0011B502A2|nr:zinc finger MYM-type protein 4-like isoform X2 [Gadus morhua]
MSCCAVGCKNRFNKNNKTRKFYRIPSTRTPFKANRRRLWLEAIRRSDWNEQIIKNATICSDHFISGEASDNFKSPDFVPSIFPSTQSGQDGRYKRKRQRDKNPCRSPDNGHQPTPTSFSPNDCEMEPGADHGTGKPSYEMFENNPDSAPSLQLGHSDVKVSEDPASQRPEAVTTGGAGKAQTSSVLAAASRGEATSGGMDDVLEGVPAFPAVEEDDDDEDEDEEDEDWQFTLPQGTLEDYDVDSPLSVEEGRRTRANRQRGDGPQVEMAGRPAYNSSSASSAGAALESSKQPDASQGGKVPIEPSAAVPQVLRPPHNAPEPSHQAPEPQAPEPSPQAPEPSPQAPEPQSQAPKQPSQAPEPPPQAPEPPPQAPEPPLLTIKDEPLDEGYDVALLPQTSISKVKEEHKDEELRISSVFSFRGGNAFAPQAPAPFPQPTTTIFIPGRGTLLQASTLATLGIKPRLPAPAIAPAPTLLALPQTLSQPQPLPPPAVISTIRCSGCSKVLVKGQTAFQRKGATQLFCSTVCLSSHLPPTSKARSCYHCNKEIDDPKSMVMVPLDNNTFIHFCSHQCLSASNVEKKKTVAQLLYNPRLVTYQAKEQEKPHCIVCKSTSKIEHEVMHQGRIHSLCSDACFLEWRNSRQLAMNCCEGCGLYCKSDSDVCQTLTVEKAQLNFCSPTCVSTYKQSCIKNTECAVCHDSVRVSNTIMDRDQIGKVQLYCSTTCFAQSRPSKHMLTGTAFPCSQCNLSQVPQYHLAMSDGHIRNFCSHECVSAFRLQKEEPASQRSLVNGAPSRPSYSSAPPPLSDGPLPGPLGGAASPAPRLDRSSPHGTHPGAHSRVTSVPPLEPAYSDLASHQAQPATPSSPGHALTQAPPTHSHLTCGQCNQRFDTKPLLFSYQGRISMFCGAACCEQYKTQRNIMAPCESCKLDNVVFEVVTFDQQDRVFCSQTCKQQFREEVTAGGKGPWRPCSYCRCESQKTFHSHYGGRVEEFCRPHCMSQYTVLFYGMARCDGCRQRACLEERLQCTSSVRNFCSRACLMQYCHLHFEASRRADPPPAAAAGRALPPPHAPSQANHPSKMNPVGGELVCLASDSATRPHATGTLPTPYTHDKTIYHASTQTDAMRSSGPRRCQVKNKSVLCRPFTLNQETMCQLPEPPTKTSDSSTAAPQPRPVNHLPVRLTDRHFLAKRLWGSVGCVVCSHPPLKRATEEEEQGEGPWGRKRARTEESKEESGTVRVAETEKGDEKEAETLEHERHLGEKEEAVQAETGVMEERGETKEAGLETGLGVAGQGATDFYCRLCPGQPGLCPAPCFEIYHTRLMYWVSPGGGGERSSPGDKLNTPHATLPLPPPSATSVLTQTPTVQAESGLQ